MVENLAEEQWQRYCSGTDRILASYVKQYHGAVRQNVEDTPNRVLYWQRLPIEYSISMLLEDNEFPKLHLWTVAWQDDEERLIRQSIKDLHHTLITPVNLRQFQKTMRRFTAYLRTHTPLLAAKTTQYAQIEETPLIKYPSL